MIANGGCCGVDIRFTQNCAVPPDRPESNFLEPRPHHRTCDRVMFPLLGTLFLVVGVEVVCLWAVRRRYRVRCWLLQHESTLCLSTACLLVYLSVCLLPVCQCICLFVCLLVCLSVCLSACLPVCLSVSPSVGRSVGRAVCLTVCLSGWLAGLLAGWLAGFLAGWLAVVCT